MWDGAESIDKEWKESGNGSVKGLVKAAARKHTSNICDDYARRSTNTDVSIRPAATIMQ